MDEQLDNVRETGSAESFGNLIGSQVLAATFAALDLEIWHFCKPMDKPGYEHRWIFAVRPEDTQKWLTSLSRLDERLATSLMETWIGEEKEV